MSERCARTFAPRKPFVSPAWGRSGWGIISILNSISVLHPAPTPSQNAGSFLSARAILPPFQRQGACYRDETPPGSLCPAQLPGSSSPGLCFLVLHTSCTSLLTLPDIKCWTGQGTAKAETTSQVSPVLKHFCCMCVSWGGGVGEIFCCMKLNIQSCPCLKTKERHSLTFSKEKGEPRQEI